MLFTDENLKIIFEIKNGVLKDIKYINIDIKKNIKYPYIYIFNYKLIMFYYFNQVYEYIYSFFSNESSTPKFEKPRGYKNIASHEPRKVILKRKNSYNAYSSV